MDVLLSQTAAGESFDGFWTPELIVDTVGVGLTLVAIAVALAAVAFQHRASVRQMELSRQQATHDRLAALYDEIGIICNQAIRVLHDTVFGRPLNHDAALDSVNKLNHVVMKLRLHGGGRRVGDALSYYAEAHRQVHKSVAGSKSERASKEDIERLQQALVPFYVRAREHLDAVWPDRHSVGDEVIGDDRGAE